MSNTASMEIKYINRQFANFIKMNNQTWFSRVYIWATFGMWAKISDKEVWISDISLANIHPYKYFNIINLKKISDNNAILNTYIYTECSLTSTHYW